MSETKWIKIACDTGFCGATHEDFFEDEGQSDEELYELAEQLGRENLDPSFKRLTREEAIDEGLIDDEE